MEPLYDQAGDVYAWLHETGKIYGLDGENLAFIDTNSVYTWDGTHVGWWQDGHIRDEAGRVALFTSQAENLGVVRPVRAVRPVRPVRAVSPVKPLKDVKPVRPVKQLVWATRIPF